MIDLPLQVDFSGKVVVVTGAGGVLCSAMAQAFAQAGAKVAALDLNGGAVKGLADGLAAEGFCCRGFQADVLDPASLAMGSMSSAPPTENIVPSPSATRMIMEK